MPCQNQTSNMCACLSKKIDRTKCFNGLCDNITDGQILIWNNNKWTAVDPPNGPIGSTKIDSTSGMIDVVNSPPGCFDITIPKTAFKSSDGSILCDYITGPPDCLDLTVAPTTASANWLSLCLKGNSWTTPEVDLLTLSDYELPTTLLTITDDNIISNPSIGPDDERCIVTDTWCEFNITVDIRNLNTQPQSLVILMQLLRDGVPVGMSFTTIIDEQIGHLGISVIAPSGKYRLMALTTVESGDETLNLIPLNISMTIEEVLAGPPCPAVSPAFRLCP